MLGPGGEEALLSTPWLSSRAKGQGRTLLSSLSGRVEGDRKGAATVGLFRIKASRSTPQVQVQAGWTMEFSGVERRREVSQSRPGRWTAGLLSFGASWAPSPSGGTILMGRGVAGRAPSGLALLHFHRPRLDGSGSLHLGGGRGGLLQRHGSQAGFFIHSFCLLNVVSLHRAHVNC